MTMWKSIGLRALPLIVAYLLVLILIQVGVINDYYFAIIVTICINIILAASLNLVVGFTGQLSLGHAGFMAIGAYTCAIITMSVDSEWGFVLGVLAGAVLAALVGALVGLPTLRLRGDYLAIATLGMSEIIRIVLLNLEATNGAAGLSPVPQWADNWNWVFGLTALTLVVLWNYVKSSHGRRAIAVREDEIAAESIGVNSTLAKVQAFTIGAFFAGIGGALYSSYFYVIKPEQFGFLKSIDILVIVVLGGLGSLSGSVIAAFLLAIISTLLQPFPGVRMILYALLLIVIMIFRPQGLLGNRELSLKLLPRFGRKRADESVGTEAS